MGMAAMALPVMSFSFASRAAFRSRTARPQLGAESRACRPAIVKAHRDGDFPQSHLDLTSETSSKCVFAGLAALAPLLSTSAAYADEPEAAATAAASAGGFGPGEVALLVTPVVVYGLFNVYRDKLNPEAKFLDYIYIMVFLAIVANLFSIVVFKTRFF